MASRREDARIEREYREFVEALGAVAASLNRLEAANDEAGYTADYDARWIPVYVNCCRTIGKELAGAVVRDAYQLAGAA